MFGLNLHIHPYFVYTRNLDSDESVTCLTRDACLTADPGVGSSIPAWSHTFVEMSGRSVHLTTLFSLASLTVLRADTFACN